MNAATQLRLADTPSVDMARFKAEGFVVAKGVLDVGQLESLLAEIDELFALQLERLGLTALQGGSRQTLHANARKLMAADIPAYLAAAAAAQALPSAHRLMLSEPLLRRVRDLGLDIPVSATPLAAHLASTELKIPGVGHRSLSRQDWRASQGSLDSLVAWAPLTSISVRSHPLEVVPRSHLFGLLPTAGGRARATIEDNRIDEAMFAPLPMQPGDVVLLSSFLVHRLSEKGDDNLRVAVSAGFSNAAEPDYAARGYPPVHAVTDHTAPPSLHALKSVYPAVEV